MGGDLSKAIDQVYAILARLGRTFSKTLKKSNAYLDSEIKAKVKDLSGTYRGIRSLGLTVISSLFSIAAPLAAAKWGKLGGGNMEAISCVSQGLSSSTQLIDKPLEGKRTKLNHDVESLKEIKRDGQESKRTQTDELTQTKRHKQDAQQADNQAKMNILKA